jgi:hypothetical protein
VPFLTIESNRSINSDQIVDLKYSPSSPDGADSAKALVSLSSGETASVEGNEAKEIWELRGELHQPPEQPSDWYLQMLINMVNGGLSIDITLQVSGFLVSGRLVGGSEYFDGMAEDFARAIPDNGTALKESFAALRDRYYPTEGSSDDRAKIGPFGPSFIHLKNARFFNTAGNPIPANGGVWWRGRVSQVGGFTLGSLSQGQ